MKIEDRTMDGKAWAWPVEDTECWGALQSERHNIDRIMAVAQRHMTRPIETIIQAGANAGMFPILLASKYDLNVLTFEPLAVNFCAMLINIERHLSVDRVGSVWPIFGAVGADDDLVEVAFSDKEQTNFGAGYVRGGGKIPCYGIDGMIMDQIDMIWFDIEGAELSALRGAQILILKDRPIIVLEIKGLGDRFETPDHDLHQFMQDNNYKQVHKEGHDHVFAPGMG